LNRNGTDGTSRFAGSATNTVLGLHDLRLTLLKLENSLRTYVYTASTTRTLALIDYWLRHVGSPLSP